MMLQVLEHQFSLLLELVSSALMFFEKNPVGSTRLRGVINQNNKVAV
jgi:hypothetical protein